MSVQEAVALALRQIAQWGVARPSTDDEWYELATQVEDTEGLAWVCPMCEEVRCDEGCPLESVRAGMIV